MSCCECNTYECITVYLLSCAQTVTLPIVANETGTWKAILEFANVSYRADIPVVNGNKITIPNRFNEYAIHTLKLYRSDDTLFNDTCYTIHIMPTVFTNPSSTPASGLVAHTTANILIDTGTAGNTYTIAEAVEALGVSRNGLTEQDWTFNAGTWTFTNPLQPGDIVRFLYNKNAA